MALTTEQVQALLRPIHPRRVLRDNKGMSHVSQQDVRAHLTRIFGFGGWSSEVLNLTCVHEGKTEGKNGWAVTYRALVRLTIKDPNGELVCTFDDVGTGTSPNLPSLGDGHDFAAKVAVSMALKRAATNLGDGFGLSLYNKGQTDPLVIGTLVMPDGQGKDASDEVPAQVSLGHDDEATTDSQPLPESASGMAGPAPEQPSVSSSPLSDADREQAQRQTVEALRERVLAALNERSRNKALQLLARINIDAAQAGVQQVMTTSPKGDPMTVSVLVDEALKVVSRSAVPSGSLAEEGAE